MNTAVATAKQTLVGKFAERYTIEPGKLLDILKATAFKQGKDEPEVTNEQLAALLVVADQYGLNPFTREIFAFNDSRKGIVPVVGIDGWSRIINEKPALDGIEFKFDTEDGDFKWCECTIYRKDRAKPTVLREYLSECKRSTGPWGSHPRRMLRHKALIQCARVAFGFAGIYDEDEAERIIEKEINAAPAKVQVAGPELATAAADAAAGGGAQAKKQGEVIDNDTGEILNRATPESVTKEIEGAKNVPTMKGILDRIMTLAPSAARDEVMRLWNAKSLELRGGGKAKKEEKPKPEQAKAPATPATPPPGKKAGTEQDRDDMKKKFEEAKNIDELDEAADYTNTAFEWPKELRDSLIDAYNARTAELNK